MEWLSQLQADRLILFALIFARVSGLMMIAPIYGTNEVPMQVRALLTFAVALVMMPTQWSVPVPQPESIFQVALLGAAEMAIGFVLGLGIVVLLSGVQLAGELIGRIGGLMLADTFDPASNTNVPLFSKLLYLMAVAVFVTLGGHRILMGGLLDSFEFLPPGAGSVPTDYANLLLTLVAQSFVLAVRVAAPMVTALLLSILVLGLISRTVPQLNILVIGFSLNAMLAFAAMMVTVGIAAIAFQEHLEVALDLLLDTVAGRVSGLRV